MLLCGGTVATTTGVKASNLFIVAPLATCTALKPPSAWQLARVQRCFWNLCNTKVFIRILQIILHNLSLVCSQKKHGFCLFHFSVHNHTRPSRVLALRNMRLLLFRFVPKMGERATNMAIIKCHILKKWQCREIKLESKKIFLLNFKLRSICLSCFSGGFGWRGGVFDVFSNNQRFRRMRWWGPGEMRQARESETQTAHGDLEREAGAK